MRLGTSFHPLVASNGARGCVALEMTLAVFSARTKTASVDAECAAALLSNLQELWDGEDDEGHRIIMAGIVEAVWCDLDKKRVEGIQFKDFLYPLKAAFPPTVAWCGTDEHRYSGKTTWERYIAPPRHAPFVPSRGQRADRASLVRAAQIAALRQDGKTWQQVAATLGLSHSRVRAIEAQARPAAVAHS